MSIRICRSILTLKSICSGIKEKRIFDLSTAKVVRPGNKKFANVRIESYAESDPSRRTTVTLSLIKQDDGKWYLDSATY